MKLQASGRPTSFPATAANTVKASCFLMPLLEVKAISRYLVREASSRAMTFRFQIKKSKEKIKLFLM